MPFVTNMAKKKKLKQAVHDTNPEVKDPEKPSSLPKQASGFMKSTNLFKSTKSHEVEDKVGHQSDRDHYGQAQKHSKLLQSSQNTGSSKAEFKKKPTKQQIESKVTKQLNTSREHVGKAPKKRISDPKLIPRMREYLDGRTNRNMVSVPLMAEYLQKKYPEYSRRKRGVFTAYIDKAYSIIESDEDCISLQTSSSSDVSDNDMEDNTENADYKPRRKRRKVLKYDDEAECFVEDEELVDYKDTNAINNMMSSMYKSSPQHAAGKSHEESQTSKDFFTIPQPHNNNSNSKNKINNSNKPLEAESADDWYFIDKKGDNSGHIQSDKIEDTNSSEELSDDGVMNELPSESYTEHYIDRTRDPRLLQRSNGVNKTVRVSHPGISIDNTGTSLEPPSSPVQPEVDDVLVVSDEEEGTVKGSRTGITRSVTEKETHAPKRGKKQKVTNKSRKNKEDTEKKEDGPELQKSTVTFADIGGNEQSLIEICKLLVHMRHPEVYQQLGVTPPRGFLLHGPPGCGKTLLANAIAGELDLPMIKIAATEVVSGVSGDSEEKVRELFDKATLSAPCILFIDEVDAITPKRETASKDMERRIVSQLLTCMDDLNKNTEAHVLVIGATNRPDSLDPALRRAGRFDKEICLGIPDEGSRKRILEVLCRNLRLTPEFDFSYLAKFTPGFVGADLMSLTREAAMVAVNRVFKDLQSIGASSDNTKNDEKSVSRSQTCTSKLSLPIDNSNTVNSETGSVLSQSVIRSDSSNVIDNVNQSQTDSSNGNHLQNTSNKDSYDGNQLQKPSDKDSSNGSHLQNTSGGHVQCDSQTTVTDSSTQSGNENVTEVEIQTATEDNAIQLQKDKPASDKESTQITSDSVTKSICSNKSKVRQSEDFNSVELSSALSWLKDQPPLTEEQLRDLYVTIEDFQIALKSVQPSAKREGFATVPDVTWEDIGALHHVREELQLAILAPVRHPEEFKALGLNRAQGILLAGPPGCGKTLLAKAVANESGINFISVKGPELLNMYVGESEKAVRTVFQRARNSSPCVIFFDELDALCPRRSGSAEGGSSTRVVNQLLTEMDGLEERKQVFIMAATNRPDIIDPAVLRPGRLDKTLYVGLPSLTDRVDILNCLTKNGTQPLLSRDVCMNNIAGNQRCENYTGADLAALVREASVAALKEAISQPNRSPGDSIAVSWAHFEVAFKKIKPSVSEKDRERYQSMGNKLAIE